MPMVAWYVLSKVSYMKRVINDVLPTARSEYDVREGALDMTESRRTTLLAEEDQSGSMR
jgi:hypothetical protein